MTSAECQHLYLTFASVAHAVGPVHAALLGDNWCVLGVWMGHDSKGGWMRRLVLVVVVLLVLHVLVLLILLLLRLTVN